MSYISWKREYGHLFEEGDDGLPLPGQVMKHFRELRGWTTSELAEVLGVTRKTVERMENKHENLDRMSRRRAVVVALSIPAGLLGITTFKGMAPQQFNATPLVQETSSESKAQLIHANLPTLWDRHYATGIGNTDDITQAITWLNKDARTTSGKSQVERLYDLCGYHLLAMAVNRRERDYTTTFEHAGSAFAIASTMENDELIAAVLMQRACSYYERGAVRTIKGKGPVSDFALAKRDFEAALSHGKKTNSILMRNISIEAGVALAKVAQDGPDKKKALALIDQVGNRLNASSKDTIFPLLPMHNYEFQNLRGLAHIHAGNFTEAISSINLAYDELASKNLTGLLGYNHLYRAQAELQQKHYPYATELASAALDIFSARKSVRGLHRVKEAVDVLSQTDYGKSPQVATLRVRLLNKNRGIPV